MPGTAASVGEIGLDAPQRVGREHGAVGLEHDLERRRAARIELRGIGDPLVDAAHLGAAREGGGVGDRGAHAQRGQRGEHEHERAAARGEPRVAVRELADRGPGAARTRVLGRAADRERGSRSGPARPAARAAARARRAARSPPRGSRRAPRCARAAAAPRTARAMLTITVRPDTQTARPAVSSVRVTASAGARAARHLLAEALHGEQRVVDREAEPEERARR